MSQKSLTKKQIISALYEFPEYQGVPWYLFLRGCMALKKPVLDAYLKLANFNHLIDSYVESD